MSGDRERLTQAIAQAAADQKAAIDRAERAHKAGRPHDAQRHTIEALRLGALAGNLHNQLTALDRAAALARLGIAP